MELEKLTDIIRNFLLLKIGSFLALANSKEGLSLALMIVLVSGISLGIGQGIILFISRVQPIRFVFSILCNAILFTFGFLFLVFSIWLNCQIPWWSLSIPFFSLVTVLGASYTPQLFSFLGALPYLGAPILSILSVWRLLAMVVGFSDITKLGIPEAFSYVVIGWVVLQLLENTLGKPLTRFAKHLTNRVAGVDIVRGRSEFLATIRNTLEEKTQTLANAAEASATMTQAITTIPQASIAFESKENKPGVTDSLQLLVSLLGMLALLIIIALVLNPLRSAILDWHSHLPELFKLIFNLSWIGVIAITFAGILAPLETLGWWAGWYEDDLETVVEPKTKTTTSSRYIIYLDGIGQSGYEYTPDIQLFLDSLRAIIPEKMKLVEGLMMYSVLNKPLDQDRPLAFFWRIADRMRLANPQAILGLFLNLRNVLIVAVSADKRYGPIYNLGIAQILYNGLIQQGYQPDSNIPITLIGYSGGGQMSVAAAPYLRDALNSPIEVISLGGVMSANNYLLSLEHLYHLVGDKDSVERIGPIIFPGRWPIFPLSFWNRAKRRGKITFFSLGPVGHQVPGGMMDAEAYLSDGRSYLGQTLGVIRQILLGEAITRETITSRVPSNYERYQQATFVQPEYYPLVQKIDPSLYLPLGDWLGRLILPQSGEREEVNGVWLEIRKAPESYQDWIGRRVKLRWFPKWLGVVTRDVHFSADAEYSSKHDGLIHPVRLNHWNRVNPLESLAGSRPRDDMMVSIAHQDCRVIEDDYLEILNEPRQVTGIYYALVRFLEPTSEANLWRVQHYDRSAQSFSGRIEIVSLPEVIADVNGCYPSTTQELEQSVLNQQGWYIYGAKNHQGVFVVQSLVPRALLKLEPQSLITNAKQGYRFIREQVWSEAVAPKGRIGSVLISPDAQGVEGWQLGDRALVIHVYGGIGGKKREPAAASPIFFGHFAYGIATVVKDPLTGALRFDIVYHQVYTHNTDGIIAGKLDWSRYMGDRQFGWAGTRPCCDLLIKFEPFTGYYSLNGQSVSPLDNMIEHLKVMTARYRIGDGTGGTYVGPANNCAQDSNQALFASIEDITRYLRENPEIKAALFRENPGDAQNLQQLQQLGRELKGVLQPFGRPRSDWRKNEFNLGSTLEDRPLINLWTGLGSWRTMLPRCASDNIVRIFLKYKANVWILRTNQIGGYDKDIEVIAPITL